MKKLAKYFFFFYMLSGAFILTSNNLIINTLCLVVMTVVTFLDPRLVVLNLLNSQIFPDILGISPSYYFAISFMVVFFRKKFVYFSTFSNNILVIFFLLSTISLFFNMRAAEFTLFISLFYLIFSVPQFLEVRLIRLIVWNLLIFSSILFIKMSFFNLDTDVVEASIASRGINRIGAIRGNSNTLAFYYGMCLFFIRQARFSVKFNVLLNIIILFSVFFTGSRTGIFVAVFSLFAVLKDFSIRILPIVVLAIGILTYFTYNLFEHYIQILFELTTSELLGGADTSRTTILFKYLNTLSDVNFSYFFGYNEFYQIKFGNIIHGDPLIIASHNTFMQILLKYGLFSFLVFFFYFVVHSRYKNWRVNFFIFFMPFLLTVGVEGNKIFYISLIFLGTFKNNRKLLDT